MNTYIDSVVSTNINRAINTVRFILLTAVPRNNLYQFSVPSLQQMKHHGVFCEKVYELIVEAITEASTESTSLKNIIQKLSFFLSKHYNCIIAEVVSDASLIKSDSDLLREQRKLRYRVRFGYLEENIAEALTIWLRDRYKQTSTSTI